MAVNNNAGCGVAMPTTNSYGPAFNAAGGGYYVMERTTSFIKVWFFSRQSAVPATVSSGGNTIDTSTLVSISPRSQGRDQRRLTKARVGHAHRVLPQHLVRPQREDGRAQHHYQLDALCARFAVLFSVRRTDSDAKAVIGPVIAPSTTKMAALARVSVRTTGLASCQRALSAYFLRTDNVNNDPWGFYNAYFDIAAVRVYQ